jgi:pimeloyl-ACP methyl ester carboxylesterase/putative sterol carrier protein
MPAGGPEAARRRGGRNRATAAAAIDPDGVAGRVRSLPRRFRADEVNGLRAEWELRIDGRTFAVCVADGSCIAREGRASAPAAILTTDASTWLAMDSGSMPGFEAFRQRRLTVLGNLELAVRLQTIFRPYRRRPRPGDLRVVDIDAGGVRLACYEAGAGEPLVLLHGLGGSKITWLPVLSALAPGHRLLAPDLPGHGDSEKPRAPDFSARYYAGVVTALMDERDVAAATVVGNSMGGRVALEMARLHPDRVHAVALLAPALPGLRWRRLMGFMRLIPSGVGAIPLPLRRQWTEVAVRRLFADVRTLPPHAVEAAAEEFLRIYADPAARLAFFATLRQIVTERPGPFFKAMRKVRQPALVVFGDTDRLVPAKLGVGLASHLPDADLRVLRRVGHVPQFEATEQTLDLLTAFLARVRAA